MLDFVKMFCAIIVFSIVVFFFGYRAGSLNGYDLGIKNCNDITIKKQLGL